MRTQRPHARPPLQFEDQFDSSAENEPTVQVFAFTQGDGSATASGLAVDADGNVVVSGDFNGQLDLSGDGRADVYSRGGLDLLLAKFDPAGSLLWVKTAGGPGEERGYRLALGLDGSIYWTGSFEHEVDFDGDGIVDVRSRGESDVFVARHDREGNLMWARSAGGPAVDYSQDLELDPLGSAYIAGDFTDHADFNDDGVADVTGIDGREIFIAKWTDDGDLVWAASFACCGKKRAGAGLPLRYQRQPNNPVLKRLTARLTTRRPTSPWWKYRSRKIGYSQPIRFVLSGLFRG